MSPQWHKLRVIVHTGVVFYKDKSPDPLSSFTFGHLPLHSHLHLLMTKDPQGQPASRLLPTITTLRCSEQTERKCSLWFNKNNYLYLLLQNFSSVLRFLGMIKNPLKHKGNVFSTPSKKVNCNSFPKY